MNVHNNSNWGVVQQSQAVTECVGLCYSYLPPTTCSELPPDQRSLDNCGCTVAYIVIILYNPMHDAVWISE